MFTAICILMMAHGSIANTAAEEMVMITAPTSEATFDEAWQRHPTSLTAAYSQQHGSPTLSITVEKTEGAERAWNNLVSHVAAQPGQRFEAAALAEGIGVHDGNGVIVSMGFYDANDRRITHVDTFVGPGDTGRRSVKMWAEAPDNTETVRLLLLLHGFGEAHFSEMQLTRLPEAGPAPDEDGVVVAVTNEATTRLRGFGYEDDGWFYNQHNAEQGVDAEAIRIREERIAWMEPDYVRMFFWYNDWNPSLDAETFTWESDNMLSHYRTLDLYQELGVRVNVCGVEWAVKDPWDNPERLARAIGALLEHLIVDRGYTCIQDYTLTNEPDIFFARAVERPAQSFDTFVELHRQVAAEFQRRGLELNIVGSDDGNNRAWFAHCVADDDYYALSDLFGSHFYFSESDAVMVKHILRDRIAMLEERAADEDRKDFIIAELGFQDERTQPPSINPLMGEYPYAMLSMSTFLDGLNAGVAGWSIWCVHEMFYPGGSEPMRFGLWDFDPPTWPVRPVYHALALMTRNSRTGDTVYRCDSSHPDWLKAARIGDRLFWVNLGDVPTRVTITGDAVVHEVRALTEDVLTHDRDCSYPLAIETGRHFMAPAKAFGVARLR